MHNIFLDEKDTPVSSFYHNNKVKHKAAPIPYPEPLLALTKYALYGCMSRC